MKNYFSTKKCYVSDFQESINKNMYHILLLNGTGQLVLDFGNYSFKGKNALFFSPYQNVKIISEENFEIEILKFHGDFYCIEYHKKEVACNGLLFNNIYTYPYVELEKNIFSEIINIFNKIKQINQNEPFSDAIIKSYLQLVLAICSREKMKILDKNNIQIEHFISIKDFQNLVEKYFIKERKPSFYAEKINISPNALSKKIKHLFKKTPSEIIQERVILEAKKQIHLTKKSIKEIATEMNFEDEFYFSKYFKKHTGISPTQFREEVGISIVAE